MKILVVVILLHISFEEKKCDFLNGVMIHHSRTQHCFFMIRRSIKNDRDIVNVKNQKHLKRIHIEKDSSR